MKKRHFKSYLLTASALTALLLGGAAKANVTMYRLYNPHTGDHHYTAGKGEYDYLDRIGWNGEGVAWYAPDSGANLYRLYNPHTGEHFYTTNGTERSMLIHVGWHNEGVASYSGGNVPVYRLYNPNARTGTHHYTTSQGERGHLLRVGWRDEGIGWYAAADHRGGGGSSGIVLNSGKDITGSFTVSQRTAVKNEPSLNAAAVAYYEAGQRINYDKTIEADGYTWASYISSSGVRRYVIMKASNAPMPPSNQTTNTLYGRAIGKVHKLNVPQYYQSTSYHCAPTTVSMMLAARGVNVDHITLGRAMNTALPFGTHNADAIRVLNRYLFGYDAPGAGQAGYRLETVRNANSALPLFKQRVMQNIKDGYPMYYTIDVSKVYAGYKGEHNIVGTGYIATPDGKDIAFLTYNDPSYQGLGQTYQGSKVITPEALLAAMTGPAATEPMYAW